ncbi:MAG TPA: hypothetical protein VKX28_16170 [Xanthobacteraceae bacterium]|nr:hypothetical protein [Xanthobacteraceae bacterium]
MSTARTALERALADRTVAISVSDSPDLGRLGLLERGLQQTVSAIVTRLVSHGARIAYGGNLDRKGYTYQLFPAVAQAYATAAVRAARPPFVHYVAAYLAQEPERLARHLADVGSFAEVRLVDRKGVVTRIVTANGALRTSHAELRSGDPAKLVAFVTDLPRASGGSQTDLEALRNAMEDDVTARIIIGGRVAGYGGGRPGIPHEALLALKKHHALVALGGFGGATRDVAIALHLLDASDALDHEEIGSGYRETLDDIAEFAGGYREAAEARGCWLDLTAAAAAEDPEEASRRVLQVMARWSPRGRPEDRPRGIRSA